MRNKARAAILGVFPSIDAYEEFLAEDGTGRCLESFVAFADHTGVISENKLSLFRDFIEKNATPRLNPDPPKNISMENLLDNKVDFLQTGLSGRGFSERINALLDKFDIALPKVSNTMLTRIKKEPADTLHKQNVLRSLAFWIGFERGVLNLNWNYVTLLKICRRVARPANVKEGVRIGFSLISRGDIIEHDIINWLKQNLKQFIKENIDLIRYGQWGVVRTYDMTTLFIDFPKDEGLSELSCYQQSIRNAIAVAHQVAIRWALSMFSTQKRFLSIGITAGNFTTLDSYIQVLLNTKLPGDPVIRVSDFARQCLLINDIRAVFNDQAKEVVLFNGEQLSLWWVVGLWSPIYWPFVAELLDDEVVSSEHLLEFLIGIKTTPQLKIDTQGKGNAIAAFFRSPQNTLLGIEIAKTLYYRNKLWEALEILRIMISVDRKNLNARTLRMMIYRNLGSNTKFYPVALIQFNRAEKEADFILAYQNALDEDFYVEYAVLKLAQAISLLKVMRNPYEKLPDQQIHMNRSIIVNLLSEAEHLFETGLSVSPQGIRSIYLLPCVRIFQGVLSFDEDVFVNPEKPLTMPVDLARKPALDIAYAIGWLRETIPVEEQLHHLESMLLKTFESHNNSLALDAYRPTIYFCFAAALWDFFPIRSIETGRNTINILKEAIKITEKCQKDNLNIYSYTRFNGEMLPPEVFIKQLSESVVKIENFVAHLEGSLSYSKEEKKESDQYLLFTHHILTTC